MGWPSFLHFEREVSRDRAVDGDTSGPGARFARAALSAGLAGQQHQMGGPCYLLPADATTTNLEGAVKGIDGLSGGHRRMSGAMRGCEGS